jgi:hypothetical protein
MNLIKKSIVGLGMLASLSGCEGYLGPTQESEIIGSEWSGTYTGHAHFASVNRDDTNCGIELRIQDLSENNIRITFSLNPTYSVEPWYAQGGEVDNRNYFHKMTQSGPYTIRTDLHKDGNTICGTLAADNLEGQRKWALEEILIRK